MAYPKWVPLPTKDEEYVLLALRQNDRVKDLCLTTSATSLGRLFAIMNGTFPVLEKLALTVLHCAYEEASEDECPRLPPAFQAPHLRCLVLNGVGYVADRGLPLLTSLSGLVIIVFRGIPDSAFLPFETLASHLQFIPRLESLEIEFDFSIHSDDIDAWEAPTNVLDAERISLPNLSRIKFQGDGDYLEGLVGWINAPHLTNFDANCFDPPPSTLHLSRLVSAAPGLRFSVASIKFSGKKIYDSKVTIYMAVSEETLDRQPYSAPFKLVFASSPLDVQIASTGQICASLTPMLSTVKTLHVDRVGGRWQFELDVDFEAAAWHDLLRPFCNVEKLQVGAGLMKDLSVALCANGNRRSKEILPKLWKITRPDYTRFRDVFDGFIAARKDVGQQIVKRRRPHNRYSVRDQVDDSEEDSNGGDDEDEDGEEGEEGEGEEGATDLGTEDEREERHDNSNTDTKPDPDPGTDDGFESSTVLDSDSELYVEY
jgi:hypothetical protein